MIRLIMKKPILIYIFIKNFFYKKYIINILCNVNILNLYKKYRLFQLLIFISIIFYIEYENISSKYELDINKYYIKLQKDLNLTFYKQLKKKINLAIYYNSIKNGGVERITSLLLNYLNNVKIFNLYLLTQKPKEDDEYSIPIKIKRIIVNSKRKNELIKILNKENIDLLIYHFYNNIEIEELNNLKNTKTIIYNNSCFLFWIYSNLFYFFKTVYKSYKKAKFIISLVPFENGYLFKKWGINSIFMNNFISFEYNYVIPSDLSSNTILMVGRGADRYKRFDLGVEAMKHIVKEIPESDMKIISDTYLMNFLENIVNLLNLGNNIKFIGYSSNPEIYYKNASLHLFPSISESFGLILSETKIFGIPNILVGLDYMSISNGGTVIIYDDNSISIAKEAIKILKNEKYKKQLGKEARKSMKKFKNELLLKKWIKLILSIYNGLNYYEKIRNEDRKISVKYAINILEKQVELLKIRLPNFKNITMEDIENFTYMENLEKI